MSDPIDPTRHDPQRSTWVGRATPRPPPPPPPAEDPYWPPVEPTPTRPYEHVPGGYPASQVRPPRQRRAGRGVLFTLLGLFTLCCGGGVALAISLNGGLNGKGTIGSAPPGLNTPVQDGKLTFVVASVTCGKTTVGRSFYTRTAKGVYCLVQVSVENTGSESTQNFSDGFQKLIGDDGTKYGADLTAGVLANENVSGLWSRIDKGEKINGIIVYDVPKEAHIVKVELHDSPLSAGTQITL
jgi:hypothetical protein